MANRLQHEDSPYLQQHRENPVDWFPWCDEAFEKAKQEHKAIFISIGYSSCHWCHVMAHEVFENEEIAAFLNEHIICIKVDREERPDIDKHYQEVHRLLNRSAGGWPTSIFCTPENKPFYAATYLPPHTVDRKMGFAELIQLIAEKIRRNDTALFKNADEIQSYLKPSKRPTEASRLTEQVALNYLRQALSNYDRTYGGFSTQPKFPHTSTLTTLLNIALLEESIDAREIVEHTLMMMRRGGMYDLVEGGFCRYSVDSRWLVPHFEKMTYDNALLCELYVTAGEKLGNAGFIDTAKQTADFMLRRMCRNGLFFAASDADTQGQEGKYFVYPYKEVAESLAGAGFEEEDIAPILSALSITEEGNFEGHSIIRIDADEQPEWFDRVRAVLQAIRDKRPYPFIDNKVLTSWNAMMVRALFLLGRHERHYHDAALNTLKTLVAAMMVDGKLFHSTLIDKTPSIEGFLEDYAWLGTAMVSAYQHTLDESWLIQAQQMANMALEQFFDAGRWFFSQGEFLTEAEITDSSYPGAVGVTVDLLLSLGSLVDHRYRRLAFKTIEYYSVKLGKAPIHYPYLYNQAHRYITEDRIIKANSTPLLEHKNTLLQMKHPYLLLHSDASADGFMICAPDRCITQTHDMKAIDRLIRDTF
jgi:uncharacterized protein YyaL (SSP411 family)